MLSQRNAFVTTPETGSVRNLNKKTRRDEVIRTVGEDDAIHEELDGFGAGDVEEEVYPLVVREGAEAGRAVDSGFEVAKGVLLV